MSEESGVLIIGAGIAGALVAAQLSGAGISVTLIDAGPRIERSHAIEQLARAVFRVPEAPYDDSPHAASPRSMQDTYLRQTGPEPFRSNYLRLVGGTTWNWLGTALRFLPADFELHRRYGVGADWPLGYSELSPWYDHAETEMGVSGHDDATDGRHAAHSYPMSGLAPTPSDLLLNSAVAPLGFNVRVSPQARNTRSYDGRPACCLSSSCIPICPIQAKYDGTVHVRKAEAFGARVLADSVAVHIDAGADGKILGCVVRRPDHSEIYLRAGHFVVAANAIEGPKLLLMSRNSQFPTGIANSSDAVGRYLMDHPVQLTRALARNPVWQRRGPQEVSAIHEMREGQHRGNHGAFITNVGNQGWNWSGPDLREVERSLAQTGLLGKALLDAVRDHADREMTLVALTEQLPDPANRITPDFDRLDAIGIPKPAVHFQFDDYTRDALAAARLLHQTLFRAIDATEIGHVPHAQGAGHIMGTTRMGSNPKTSVADALGKSHDHSNLWFAGSSLFPTSAAANPTLTIAALALRTAKAIKTEIQGQA